MPAAHRATVKSIFDKHCRQLTPKVRQSDIEALEVHLSWVLAGVVIVGTLLAGLLGWHFAGTALKPLRRLAGAVVPVGGVAGDAQGQRQAEHRHHGQRSPVAADKGDKGRRQVELIEQARGRSQGLQLAVFPVKGAGFRHGSWISLKNGHG